MTKNVELIQQNVIKQAALYHEIPKEMTDNSRWIYLRITNIKLEEPSQEIKQEVDNQLIFQVADKKCHCSFSTKSNTNHAKIHRNILQPLKNETHIFCYEAQELLTIKLVKRKIMIQGYNIKKQLIPEVGFAKVFITPFIVMPYTRHKMKINLIKLKEDKKVQNKNVATIEVEIFYMLNFQADIQVSPLYGRFTRNTALLGTMRLCCIFSINEQRKKSIIADEGGIYPNWQKQSQKAKGSGGDRQKYSKQAIKNIFSFKLNSVGHILKIQVVNFPLIGKDAQLVGVAQIRIESHDFFRIPNQQIIHDKENAIKLWYNDPYSGAKVEAGEIIIKSKFYFNAKAIRQQIDSQQDQESIERNNKQEQKQQNQLSLFSKVNKFL